jgi:ABC-type dipeptide/oligopeptide/nickel transport system ATPase component
MCSKPAIASNAGRAVLEASGLDVVYDLPKGEIRAVSGFGISIGERELVGLVGESGSGKSTAALALMGLVRAPGRIAGGEVRFRGRELLGRPEGELRAIRGREMALIVQNPRGALNPLVPVGLQVANVYQAHHDAGKKEAFERAVAALASIGMPDAERRARAYPHQLSGGMAQRVLIAMATINEPRLLIADEPTTGLDVTVQAQFLEALQARVAESGSAVLFVTHDLGIVAHYCDRVLVMYRGRVVEEADTAALFSKPANVYTQQLIASAADRTAALSGRRGVLRGRAPRSREGAEP